jgi:hypothetical protein
MELGYNFVQGTHFPTAGYADPDQPFIGFSTAFVALDVVCFNDLSQPTDDTAILIPTNSVTAGTGTLPITPLSTANFGSRATPSRDRSLTGNSNIWFVSSDLPDPPDAAAAPIILTNMVNSAGTVTSEPSQTLPLAAGDFTFVNKAPQLGCTATETAQCAVRANDARIQAVDLQTRPTNGTSYLSYAFVYPPASGGYLDTFLMQPTADLAAGVIEYISYNDGTYLLFPTIAMDADLNFEFTGTVFSSTGYPSVQVYQSRYYPDTQSNDGYAPLSAGYLFSGSASFTEYAVPAQNGGCQEPDAPQRWGDFNTTVWDPYMQSSSGKPSTFWNVFEYANADPNNSNPDLTSIQSSYWYQVNDPLPYYIGDVNEEATSPCKTGQKCTVTLSVPSGTQAGDVLLANIGIGEDAGTIAKELTPPDSSWTLLPFLNTSGPEPWFLNSVPCGADNRAGSPPMSINRGMQASFLSPHPPKTIRHAGLRSNRAWEAP